MALLCPESKCWFQLPSPILVANRQLADELFGTGALFLKFARSPPAVRRFLH
jgi:hypothetical protein